jgi:hypothetical protein
MAKQKTFFGYQNAAAFNRDPAGDVAWYETRAERDAALAETREWAVRNGLSTGAAKSGIWAVKRVVRGIDAIYEMSDSIGK